VGSKYKRYAAVTLALTKGGAGTPTKALIDSGNEWRTVISDTLAARLGFRRKDLKKLSVSPVGTARKGTNLQILGEIPTVLFMQFTAAPRLQPLMIRPAVVEGLAMECNISGPFLKGHEIDHLHTKDALKKEGCLIPLMAPIQAPRRHVYAAGSCVLEPWSCATVPLRVGGIGDPTEGGTYDGLLSTPHLRQWGLEIAGASKGQAVLYNPTRRMKILRNNSRIGTIGDVPDGKKALKGPDETKRSLEQELRDVLKHDDSALSTPQEVEAAYQLLLDHIDVFSADGEFGHTSLIKHSIHTGAIVPVKSRNRPISPTMIDDLKNQVNEWLRHGVIEPSTSPWSSALVAAKKKNGKTRWCVDYRALNEATTKDAYPMPLIEENLVQLSKSRIFSSVDGSGAFHVVDLDDDAKPKTAFSTPWGLYQFKRMPFGLCNAPATYSRLMHIVLRQIPTEQALSYLDDTLVHSVDFPQHCENLRRVLVAHREAGLKLQPSKCHFFLKEVEYLGHMVSERGMRIVPGYTEVVRKWPLPQTVTEMRAFLGKVGYYRRFIKDYGAIARPLSEATKEENLDGKKIRMTDEIKAAHLKLRKALCEAPILAYPRFDGGPFIVDTDWSYDNRAIGGVLSQVQEGNERAICYGAKKLSSSQANYSATKGELFAIIYFLRHWRYYLQYRRFTLRTDHRALTWIRTMEAPTGMISRWLDTLANFDFEVVYRKGTAHGNADGLSRAPHAPPIDEAEPDEVIGSMGGRGGPSDPTPDPDPDLEEINTEDMMEEVSMEEVLSTTPDGPYLIPRTAEQWAKEQLRDRDLREAIALLRGQELPEPRARRHLAPRVRSLLDLVPLLYLDPGSGALRLKKEDDQPGVPIVPLHLEEPLARLAHELAGHRGVWASTYILHLQAYALSGAATMRRIVETCWPCQVKSGEQRPQRHTYRTVVSGFPFQRISIDFVGPLRPTKAGNTCILTVKDTFTKWVEAFPMRAARAEEAASLLIGEVFARYGYPDEVHSDRGTQFTGKIMRQLGDLIGYSITWTPTYHPQSNPVERAHRDLKAGLRAALETVGGQEWDLCLPQILFAFRCAPARGTGLSPFETLFGRLPNIPIGAIDPPPTSGRPLAEYVTKLRGRILDVHRWARDNLAKEVARQQRAYQAAQKEFEVGDLVWRYNPIPQKGGKFARSWTGPWEVAYKLSPVLYKLRDDVGNTPDDVVPIDRLKSYYPAPNHGEYLPSRQARSPTALLDLTLLPRPSADPQHNRDESDSDDWHTDSEDDEDDPPGNPPAAHAPPVPGVPQANGVPHFHGGYPDELPAAGNVGRGGDPAGGGARGGPRGGRHHVIAGRLTATGTARDLYEQRTRRANGGQGRHEVDPTPYHEGADTTPRGLVRTGAQARTGESSAGRTPGWRALHPKGRDRRSTSGAHEGPDDGQGTRWRHQPVDFYTYDADDSAPEAGDRHSPPGTLLGPGGRPKRRYLPAGANLQPDTGTGIQDGHRQPQPRGGRPHYVGPGVPDAARDGQDQPHPRRGRPPTLSAKYGPGLPRNRRGRPRVSDKTVSFPIARGARTRVEKPYLRSDAARQRQGMRALRNVQREEALRRKKASRDPGDDSGSS
jgi:hypothetical protein